MSDVAVREGLPLADVDERVALANAKLTPTALVLVDEIPFEQYQKIGSYLGQLRDATAWWIGDWLFFGDGVYGEMMAQATEATGRSKGTLQNYLYVATNVPRSRRREALSWSHHREIAKLTPREQSTWLDRCEKHGWSIEEFRGMLREPAPIEARVASEPIALTPSEVADVISTINSATKGPSGALDGAVDVLEKLMVASKSNGRVAVVVSTGKPCSACGGSGVESDG